MEERDAVLSYVVAAACIPMSIQAALSAAYPDIIPTPGEAEDLPTLALASQLDLDAVWALSRKVFDVTADARITLRRRAFARGDALSVRLPGDALAPWATARLEPHCPDGGRGEAACIKTRTTA